MKRPEPHLLRDVAGDAATRSELRLLGAVDRRRRQRARRRAAASLAALALAAALPLLPRRPAEAPTPAPLAAHPAPIAPAQALPVAPAPVVFLTDAQLLDLFADRGAILITHAGGRQELRLAGR